jgi:glyoxylase-like metal-dependent hydrolase (beta-lactamase superfamily II)
MRKIILWTSSLLFIAVAIGSFVFYPIIKGMLFLSETKLDNQLSIFTTMMSGNSTVFSSKDGKQVVVIDTKFGKDSEKMHKKITVRYPGASIMLINTHSHHDHTGGNELYKKSHLISGTFSREQWMNETKSTRMPDYMLASATDTTINIDDEQITIRSVTAGHTCGDIAVFFHNRKVLCTGDLVFNGMHPVLFKKSGATVSGWIKNCDSLIALNPLTVVPGHGDSGDISLIKNQRDYFLSIQQSLTNRNALEDVQRKYKKLYSIKNLATFGMSVNFMHDEF